MDVGTNPDDLHLNGRSCETDRQATWDTYCGPGQVKTQFVDIPVFSVNSLNEDEVEPGCYSYVRDSCQGDAVKSQWLRDPGSTEKFPTLHTDADTCNTDRFNAWDTFCGGPSHVIMVFIEPQGQARTLSPGESDNQQDGGDSQGDNDDQLSCSNGLRSGNNQTCNVISTRQRRLSAKNNKKQNAKKSPAKRSLYSKPAGQGRLSENRKLSKQNNISYSVIVDLLMGTVQTNPSLAGKMASGGSISAYNAVEKIAQDANINIQVVLDELENEQLSFMGRSVDKDSNSEDEDGDSQNADTRLSDRIPDVVTAADGHTLIVSDLALKTKNFIYCYEKDDVETDEETDGKVGFGYVKMESCDEDDNTLKDPAGSFAKCKNVFATDIETQEKEQQIVHVKGRQRCPTFSAEEFGIVTSRAAEAEAARTNLGETGEKGNMQMAQAGRYTVMTKTEMTQMQENGEIDEDGYLRSSQQQNSENQNSKGNSDSSSDDGLSPIILISLAVVSVFLIFAIVRLMGQAKDRSDGNFGSGFGSDGRGPGRITQQDKVFHSDMAKVENARKEDLHMEMESYNFKTGKMGTMNQNDNVSMGFKSMGVTNLTLPPSQMLKQRSDLQSEAGGVSLMGGNSVISAVVGENSSDSAGASAGAATQSQMVYQIQNSTNTLGGATLNASKGPLTQGSKSGSQENESENTSAADETSSQAGTSQAGVKANQSVKSNKSNKSNKSGGSGNLGKSSGGNLAKSNSGGNTTATPIPNNKAGIASESIIGLKE